MSGAKREVERELAENYCQEHRQMVREMLDTEDRGFNNWEIEFLDNMYRQTIYTERQMAKIEQIYTAKM